MRLEGCEAWSLGSLFKWVSIRIWDEWLRAWGPQGAGNSARPWPLDDVDEGTAIV